MKHYFQKMALAALLTSGLSLSAHAGRWAVTDLGPASNQAFLRLNNAGQVVGSYDNAQGHSTGFVTGPGGRNRVDLVPLGGHETKAFGINNAGRVVAQSSLTDSTSAADYVYAITAPGQLQLQALVPQFYLSGSGGINDRGQVVGSDMAASSMFITGPDGQGLSHIQQSQPNALPKDINAKGQILYGDQAGGVFITGPNGVGTTQVKPSFKVDYMSATALNDQGQVVGELRRHGDNLPRAFITGPQGKGVRELSRLGAQSSDALGINRFGQVVGMLDSPKTGEGSHAFVTGPQGIGVRDLTREVKLPEGYLTHAYDVNDQGQVVAYDYYHGRAYLLTPLPRR